MYLATVDPREAALVHLRDLWSEEEEEAKLRTIELHKSLSLLTQEMDVSGWVENMAHPIIVIIN